MGSEGSSTELYLRGEQSKWDQQIAALTCIWEENIARKRVEWYIQGFGGDTWWKVNTRKTQEQMGE
jgi:hypothetical protein